MLKTTAMQFIKRYRPDSEIKFNGDWLISKCIIERFEPHHSHGDRTPSAGLNVKTGRYNCFTWSDHSISWKQLCNIIGENYEFESEPNIGDDFSKAILDSYACREAAKLDIDIYENIHHEYMTKYRHFSDAVLSQAQVRYDQFSGRIVIPIWKASLTDDKELVGIQKRVIPGVIVDNKIHQKYENSKNFNKSDFVYAINALDTNTPLLVFESVMSVFRAWDYGFSNVCCTLGSHMSVLQADFIKRFDDVVLWYDGDMSGLRGTRDAIHKLSNVDLKIVDSTDIKNRDIADIPKRLAISKISSAVSPYEWIEANASRI